MTYTDAAIKTVAEDILALHNRLVRFDRHPSDPASAAGSALRLRVQQAELGEVLATFILARLDGES